MFKKTLQEKLKNTLQDAPLVLNPVSSALNKEETLSVQNKVLSCNLSEVDLLQHTGGQNSRVSDKVYVLVLNKRKEFLMHIFCSTVRLLLLYNNSSLTIKKILKLMDEIIHQPTADLRSHSFHS